jgi:diketogulonate reductase-like aldo/keto reductase
MGGLAREVSVIGQGTWNMEADDRKASIAALRRGLDLGMTHIDTAELYGHGAVEELVGEAIRGRRDEVFLVSKVLPSNASYEGTLRACDRSLKRLRTDRLDLYLLHWPGSEPLAETIRAFQELVRVGKVLAWGVSNFDVDELEAALRLADRPSITCNQVLYHLDERGMEARVLPWCEDHGVAVVGYSPFGSGRFPGARTPRGRVLEEIAKKRGATPRQIALRFLVRRPSLFAIPKASKGAHAEENAGAARVALTDDDIARVDRTFPMRVPRSLPTL